MKENVIARRYARGLVEHAVEGDELGTVRQDLDRLADLLDPDRGDISVPELGAFLGSPTVQPSEKIALTDVLCEKLEIGKTVSNFLNLLITKNRIGLTGYIAREFDRFAADFDTVDMASVETAKALTDTERQALEEGLSTVTGRKARLHVKINEDLIGGLRIQIGDVLFDGSLANRLRKLEKITIAG